MDYNILGIIIVALLVTVPPIIVAVTVYFAIGKSYEKELKKQVLDLKHHSKEVITPIRLQSYERIALFLERMKPESLLLRHPPNNLPKAEYRTVLLAAIRSELEHNLSQQVYVSSALWDATKKAKEETVKIINVADGKVGLDASATDLATKILEIYVDLQYNPSDDALNLLRQEIKELY
jgi:predicted nucleotide-binding protein (sugar kinase/HSP70/actin superfamily)